MAIRGIGDAFAFQRLLWLLVGTVIVPTVLLSAFGIAAIRNRGAAIEARLRSAQDAHLERGAARLRREVDRLDVAVRSQLGDCLIDPEGSCDFVRPGVARVWLWDADTPPPPDLPLAAVPRPEPTTTWSRASSGPGPIGVHRLGDIVLGWQLEVDALLPLLTDLEPQGDGATLQFVRADTGSMDALVEHLQGLGVVRERPLDGPLDGWRLGLTYANGDPLADLTDRAATLYALILAGLVATVMAGTFITLSSAAREIRLSRLQTDFVSTVSHELRTPLTSIRMFVETLQSGRIEDPERIQECLDLLGQETDRLSRLIERVLDWARMEAGRRIYELEVVAPDELVAAALTAFRTQTLMDDQTTIDIDIPSDLPPLQVDRDAIVEALVNLLQNAHKYAPAPRHIHLSATLRGRRVGLGVEDDGPGIPRHERKRVFEKFYQSDARLSRRNQGSGLGLAIVRAVVHAHGGTVELDTELARGSKFTLWLPVA